MHMKRLLTASAVTLLLAFSSLHAAPGSETGTVDTTTQDNAAAMPMQGSEKMRGNGPGMMGKGMQSGGQGKMSKGIHGSGHCKMGKNMHGRGHGMMGKHQNMISRLDLMEARLAKIEVLLERMSQR